MIGTRIAQYRILEKVGGGGMGVVYKARDEKLERFVAIKFLPLDQEATEEERARFVHEARAASALDHKNVCTIHEIDEAPDGRTFIVMAYYEGESLAGRLKRSRPELREALRIGLQMAEGLAAAHARDIVHRDVKPANVMLADDGEAKLVDFGLAKLEGQTRLTRTGSTLGTVAYMAPEQARGEEVDDRADVFALGAVLYEMLEGRPAFDGPHDVAVVTAVLHSEPEPMTNAAVPAGIRDLVMRSLRKDAGARPSASEVAEGLERGLESLTRDTRSGSGEPLRGTLRRPAVILPLLVAGLAAVVWVVKGAQDRTNQAWAAEVAVPEIRSLLDQGRHSDAYALAREAQQRVPNNPAVDELADAATLPLSATSDPSGATVYFRPYLDTAATWMVLGTTPLEARVPADYGRFRVELEGYQPVDRGATTWMGSFDESLVPLNESVPGMVRIPAGAYGGLADGQVEIPAFWIDRYEVTNAEYARFVNEGGYTDPEYWPDEMTRLFGSWEAGIAALEDATGRPGPASWRVGAYPEGRDDHPVAGVSWFEAVAYCAFVGKRLPTLFHWTWATGSQTDIWAEVTVLSNFGGSVLPVGASGAVGGHGTHDMAGNVAEWAWTEGRDGSRYALGGGFDDPEYVYVETRARAPASRAADLGFRCARYDAEPEASLLVPVADAVYDFADRAIVNDAVFDEWRNFYAYDPLALDARQESVEPGVERFDRETVSFTAAYGDERVTAFVFLPRDTEPPYQAVVYSPGATAYVLRSSRTLPDLNFADFIMRSGRAFVYPMYAGSYERGWNGPARGPAERRDRQVMAIQDLMRTVDYLEEREDIDADRLAYMGVSAGAEYGANRLAIEGRFRAAVWIGGGYDPTHMQHEPPFLVPWNYAPRVRVPVLMLNGSRDYSIPVETGQLPLFEDLGTPPEHKRHQVFEGGHIPPQTEIIRESLDWLDRYLGPVGSPAPSRVPAG